MCACTYKHVSGGVEGGLRRESSSSESRWKSLGGGPTAADAEKQPFCVASNDFFSLLLAYRTTLSTLAVAAAIIPPLPPPLSPIHSMSACELGVRGKKKEFLALVRSPTPPTGSGSGAARGTLHRSPVELCRLSFVLEGKKKKGRAEAVKVAGFFLCFFSSPSTARDIYLRAPLGSVPVWSEP